LQTGDFSHGQRIAFWQAAFDDLREGCSPRAQFTDRHGATRSDALMAYIGHMKMDAILQGSASGGCEMRCDAGTTFVQEMSLFLAADLAADRAHQLVELFVGLQQWT
jgi:hypothetical protein